MKVVLDCIPCYLTQAMNTIRQTEIPEEQAVEILHKVMPLIPKLDLTGTPAENSSQILWKVNELLGNDDPFLKAKRDSNELALSLLPKLRKKINESEDSLYTALQVSVAGNIIDMGILKDFNVETSIQEALEKKFARDDYILFRNKLRQSKEIMILGDNSGEIAFDKLLAEQLRALKLRVIYVVKESPILNDATIQDANQVGMREVAEVLSNGSGFLGTVVKDCSEELRAAFEQADLVISKGQANYESLESTPEAGEKTYFLLRAKCEVVAKSLGVNLGEMVFYRG